MLKLCKKLIKRRNSVKLGNDLLKAIEETKGDINDPKATAQLKGQVTNYKNG